MEQNRLMDLNNMMFRSQDQLTVYSDNLAPTPIGMQLSGGQMPNMMKAPERQFPSMEGMSFDNVNYQYNNASRNDFNFSAFANPQQQMAQMVRKRQMNDFEEEPAAKRTNFNVGLEPNACFNPVSNEPNSIPPSTEGIKFYSRNDVLCGRGGGTNVHPGNRRFRDLINANRRSYLKARKNDKPAISRFIVRAIREMNGRFLKKDEKIGLWFEIGDDGAREKTSQGMRQRAPEMKKVLFEDKQRQQQEALLQHRLTTPSMSNFGSGPSTQMIGGSSMGSSMGNFGFNSSRQGNSSSNSLITTRQFIQQLK